MTACNDNMDFLGGIILLSSQQLCESSKKVRSKTCVHLEQELGRVESRCTASFQNKQQ